MKTKTLSVTKLLQRVSSIFDTLDSIRKMVDEKNKAAFSVRFVHNKDLVLIRTEWSDRYNQGSTKADWFRAYRYEIKSDGIHFTSFEEHAEGTPWYSNRRSWEDGNEESIPLVQVPNNPPPGYKSMYLFHQEKIRETLSALPAWAIACVSD